MATKNHCTGKGERSGDCMKPQEEAEEIVNKTVFAIDQYYQNYADYRIEMKLEISQKIPLAELIAVARAAVTQHNNHCNPEYCSFCKAVYALRATEKVKI